MTAHIRRKKRAKKPAVSVAMPTAWDMGATGPANRAGLVIEARGDVDPTTGTRANPNGVKGARRVDMLEIWHRKGIITTNGYNAAERLRNAMEATMRAPGWPDNDRVQSSPKPDHAVTIQIDRISAFHAIAKHIAPPDQPIIYHCVINGGIPASLRVDGSRPYHGRGYQIGLQHLSDALDRLSRATS